MQRPEAFKIRLPNGRFSCGGAYLKSSRNGKVWGSRGALKQHISLVTECWHGRGTHPYAGAMICDLMAGTEEAFDVAAAARELADRLKKWPFGARRSDILALEKHIANEPQEP